MHRRSIRRPRGHADQSGFTLVELLVVIAIIGMLVALLLPAIQAARESARRTECRNNLGNLAKGCLQHEAANGHLPTGGWSGKWSGDPDCGFGRGQPGGWTYTILPYIDAISLFERGATKKVLADKKADLAVVAGTARPSFYCPTRRQAITYPNSFSTINAGAVPYAARTDYAANAGAGTESSSLWSGPSGGDPLAVPASQLPKITSNGVIYALSTVAAAGIPDGQSNTLLLAEKYMNSSHYSDGLDVGDQDSSSGYGPIYCGAARNTLRWSHSGPMRDRNEDHPFRFGSAHGAGVNIALCDGSVRQTNYSINPSIFDLLCNRADHQPIDPSQL